MANKRKRLDKQMLMILGAVLSVEAVGCVGVVLSAHGRKVAQEKILADRTEALDNVRVASATLPALQEQYSRMQAQVAVLESTLPPAEYIPTLLGQIEQTAIHSGVQIRDFRPKGSTSDAGSGPGKSKDTDGSAGARMQFDMNVSGTYRQMQLFLANLTRFRKILALDSIKLQPQQTGGVGASPMLNGGLSFTAYILPPGTRAVTGASGAPAADHAATAANPATAGATVRSASVSGGATRG